MALKVLTVDDSKTIRMIVKKAFKPYDCQLSEAENGVEGLAAANREKPDLIILDITMPVMNGVEMLSKLKTDPALSSIPVIMLTAESGKANVMEIVKMGVKDYVVKPFKDVQLIERVEKVVALEPKKKEAAAEGADTDYFSANGDIPILGLPEKLTKPVILGVEGSLQSKIREMVDSSTNNLILDLRKITEINVSLIKLIISVTNNCQKSNINIRIVGTSTMSTRLKEFQETSALNVNLTLDEAKAAF